MFAVYKKLTTPETSPILGPSKSPDSKPLNANGNDDKKMEHSLNAAQRAEQPLQPESMDSFSLCDCCSPRLKPPSNASHSMPMQEPVQYEFGHATHYKHNSTIHRVMCDFDLSH